MSCTLVFYVNMMNWNLRRFGVGNWSHKAWQVYDNGHVILDETYDPICEPGHADWLTNRDKSIVARSTGRLTAEAFGEFMHIVNDQFPTFNNNRDGCDGTGFEMRSYSADGKHAHSFTGYIYHIEPLKRIMYILNAIHMKPHKPEQWLEVNGKYCVKLKALDEGKDCCAYIVNMDRQQYLAKCFDEPERFEAELRKYDGAAGTSSRGQRDIIIDERKLCILREYRSF